jgi:hypothetical protein
MHVLIHRDLIGEISAAPRADVKARKVTTAQSRVVLSDTAARERAIMARLIMAALSGTIFRVRRHSYNSGLFDSSWMALLLVSRVCCRFHRVGPVSMEGLRTILGTGSNGNLTIC